MMEQRCERCLKALPTDHVGDPLCGPCRRDAAVRDALLAPRPARPRSGTRKTLAAEAPRP